MMPANKDVLGFSSLHVNRGIGIASIMRLPHRVAATTLSFVFGHSMTQVVNVGRRQLESQLREMPTDSNHC